jgi:hypothetical protein
VVVLFNLVLIGVGGYVIYLKTHPDSMADTRVETHGEKSAATPGGKGSPPSSVPDNQPGEESKRNSPRKEDRQTDSSGDSRKAEQPPKGQKNDGNERRSQRLKLTDFFVWSEEWQGRIRDAQAKGNPLLVQDLQEKYQRELEKWDGKQLEGSVNLLYMQVEENSYMQAAKNRLGEAGATQNTKNVYLTVSVRFDQRSSDQLRCLVADADDPVLRKLAQGQSFYIRGTFKTQLYLLTDCKVTLQESNTKKGN